MGRRAHERPAPNTNPTPSYTSTGRHPSAPTTCTSNRRAKPKNCAHHPGAIFALAAAIFSSHFSFVEERSAELVVRCKCLLTSQYLYEILCGCRPMANLSSNVFTMERSPSKRLACPSHNHTPTRHINSWKRHYIHTCACPCRSTHHRMC